MLRRIAAFIFVLTVAGNVWAGLCECIDMGDDHAVSSCCEREHSEQAYMAAKPCCETDCNELTAVSVHRQQSESGIKIPLPAHVLASSPPVPALRMALSAGSMGIDASFVDLRLGFPRPPNLYLKHHSFLI